MNLQPIIKKITPGNELVKHADDLIVTLSKELNKKGVSAVPVLGGSLAKHTNLKGDFDVDVFVKFDLKYKSEDLSDLLFKSLSVFKKVTRLHGSRDYFHVIHKRINFEIVPVLNISDSSQALNVTDVSPLHAIWVGKNIGKLSSEIRLAKKFCKSQGVYGAESYINGFSGYILEILVIHYKGFNELLKAVSKWKPKHVIDTAKYYPSSKDVFNVLNVSKLQSPLVVIDPVQKDRNAAATLSIETFCKFILAAKMYLANPSKSFFEKQEFSVNSLKTKAKHLDSELFIFNVSPEDGKPDVVGSKILKVYTYVKSQFSIHGFTVVDSGWEWNSTVHFWFFIYPKELPKYKKHPGPLVYSSEEHVDSFLKKHKDFVVEDDKIIAIIPTRFRKPKDFVKFIITDNCVKEKVKSLTLV